LLIVSRRVVVVSPEIVVAALHKLRPNQTKRTVQTKQFVLEQETIVGKRFEASKQASKQAKDKRKLDRSKELLLHALVILFIKIFFQNGLPKSEPVFLLPPTSTSAPASAASAICVY
jgi:hypothetical protein